MKWWTKLIQASQQEQQQLILQEQTRRKNLITSQMITGIVRQVQAEHPRAAPPQQAPGIKQKNHVKQLQRMEAPSSPRSCHCWTLKEQQTANGQRRRMQGAKKHAQHKVMSSTDKDWWPNWPSRQPKGFQLSKWWELFLHVVWQSQHHWLPHFLQLIVLES